MIIKILIIAISFISSFLLFVLFDFLKIISLNIHTLLFFLFCYFSIASSFTKEVNKIPLNEDFDEYFSFFNRGINSNILDIRKLTRKRLFLNQIVFSTISCLLYPLICIFWFIQFFNIDLSGKILCFFEPKIAHYFYKDYIYKVENVIEEGKEYEKSYCTSSRIEWRLNGLLHRETNLAIEYDVLNCEYHNMEFFFCAFGKKYKDKKDMEKALISNSFNNF